MGPFLFVRTAGRARNCGLLDFCGYTHKLLIATTLRDGRLRVEREGNAKAHQSQGLLAIRCGSLVSRLLLNSIDFS